MAATVTLTLKNDLSEVVRGARAIEAQGEARGWPRLIPPPMRQSHQAPQVDIRALRGMVG